MGRVLGRIGDFLYGLEGRWRLLAAFVAGLAFALGFEPFRIFPAMLLSLAALVLLLDGAIAGPRPIRAAAFVGWAFGFGQFLLGLHWIFYPFLVDPVAHAWQIPFAALMLPGGLALFIAAATAAAALTWRAGPSRIFLLALSYGLAEWLRGHVLTGFPWNIAAYGWAALPGVMQAAALFGSYALTLLTLLRGASLAELFRTRPSWPLPAAMCAAFALLWLWGEARLAGPQMHVAGVSARLVQPAIPEDEKNRLRFVARNWQRLIALSAEPANRPPTVIVWPEAALPPPYYLELARLDPAVDIASLTGRGSLLMTGALRVEEGEEPRYYNSFFIIAGTRGLLAVYDKFHLVPFGEYLPFEKTLGALGIEKLTGIAGSFSAGDGPHTYDVPGLPPIGPLICYEILFPGEVADERRRPGVLVNVTDDAWFGPWAGPRQHLLVARMRAIEEGLPVLRAANTGISAVIDSYGRITGKLGTGKIGVVDSPLPAAIAPTPYSRFQGWMFWLFAVASGCLAWMFSKGKSPKQRAKTD
jgi:apolipoprotein N-acyltransferase